MTVLRFACSQYVTASRITFSRNTCNLLTLTENCHFLANLEHTTSFLVDESGDALDAAATSQTTDGRLKIEKLGQSQNFLQHSLDLPW